MELVSSTNAEPPLPPYCGMQEDALTYRLTPEQRRARDARHRKANVAALCFYRLQAGRAAAHQDATAASFYAERAAMFARALRASPRVPDTGATDLREEIRSWVVMADVIAREAHLTTEHYYWA